jgi:hypothetical protein
LKSSQVSESAIGAAPEGGFRYGPTFDIDGAEFPEYGLGAGLAVSVCFALQGLEPPRGSAQEHHPA